ncbi:hypothetical protein [Cupriavidus basilensis]|uniref:hypothetical protein n=1 Tax=Cupriavidus basilensis TaxID=68895 RepID=UPI0023E8B319|nr:hypothetical protein [Cupriavidus basilensis]MDF3885051.1 hypothetical protein [Cupriavidus basilensis]
MFQTSSKSAQHRRSGAGSATAVMLLGAGLACAGPVRADEGTGIEALGTLGATDPAGFTAPPAMQAETNNPYLAAALGSMAGRTPVSQEPLAVAALADRPADGGATLGAADAPDAADLAPPVERQTETVNPVLAASDLAPAAPDRLEASSGGFDAASRQTLPAAGLPAAASAPRRLAVRSSAGAPKPVAPERLEDLRGGFAAASLSPDAAGAAARATPAVTLATAGTSPTHAARSTMASWKPVAQERLDDLRGGFDVGAGLQVSFGIERAVYINGALVVATSLTIPDVSRITADQASRLATALGGAAGAAAMASAAVNNALAGNPVTANGANGSSSTGSSSSSTGTSASATGSPGASVTSLPATAIAAGGAVVTTNGALSLIQNGPGNSVASSMMAGTPATVIQNSLNNQSIQNLVTINAGVNTLQAFRAQVANSALNSALQSAASRH